MRDWIFTVNIRVYTIHTYSYTNLFDKNDLWHAPITYLLYVFESINGKHWRFLWGMGSGKRHTSVTRFLLYFHLRVEETCLIFQIWRFLHLFLGRLLRPVRPLFLYTLTISFSFVLPTCLIFCSFGLPSILLSHLQSLWMFVLYSRFSCSLLYVLLDTFFSDIPVSCRSCLTSCFCCVC